MKKVFCILTVLMLMTGLFACAEGAADPGIVTVMNWLEAKGECQPCRVKVTVLEIVNPVLALVGDETGTVNLFGVAVDGEFTDFLALDLQVGEVLLLEDPVYNEYEGTIEMADSVLVERLSA